jgi:hypothetical protein
MAAPVYSLLTTDEALAALRVQDVGNITTQLEESWLPAVTELCEQVADTRFVERQAVAIEEIHDLQVAQGFLQLRRRPIIDAAALKLYIPFDGSEVEAEAFLIDEAAGRLMIRNLSASGRPSRPPSQWDGPGFVDFPEDYYVRLGGGVFPAVNGAAKVSYRGGYVDTDSVPGALKRAAASILARWYREEERKSQGLTGEIAQGFSFASKFSDAVVTQEDRRILKSLGNLSRTARAVLDAVAP